jgi:preprotein translocase subunit Sss1
MNDILSQLLGNYLIWNPIKNESTKYNVETDEGYQNAIELLANARKLYDESPAKEFFDSLLEGSFVEFLDGMYSNVVKAHEAAVKEREAEAAKTDFDRLSEVDKQNVTTAVDTYLEKYENASEETKTLAKDILKDYTAWVIRTTRKPSKDELSKDTPYDSKCASLGWN